MDKYSAVWVSHSSINDFRRCPRAYYLKNLYRDKHSGHKIALVTPSLALGSSVHEVLESLSVLPASSRFLEPLLPKFKAVWSKFKGLKGGFESSEQEDKFFERGRAMLQRVFDHPGPLQEKAVKIQTELPYFWLSQTDNLILCGKLDWLQYDELSDSVRILDFKTGLKEESPASLQLPIYLLLATNCQTKKVAGASYWYLARDDMPRAEVLPDYDQSHQLVLKYAKAVKLARTLERFKCPQGEGGCRHCLPYEKIIAGKATFVGLDNFERDVYALVDSSEEMPPQAEIL